MSSEPRRLTVVRHSQSTHNRDRIWAGWQDPPLTSSGRQDAWYAAAHWKHAGLSATTSSDLDRARHGARIIAENLDIPYIEGDPRLRERDAGRWQGLTYPQYSKDPLYQAWAQDPTRTPPGGEDWEHFTSRIEEAVRHLLDTQQGHTLAVTHDGVIQALSTHLDRQDAHPCRPLTEGMTLTLKDGRIEAQTGRTICEVCRIRDREATADQLKMLTRHMTINSYRSAEEEPERPGWILISPRRHVTRWHQMDEEETSELGRIARGVDAALTLHTGARRVMIASLGWNTSDHLHVHCVPTFDPTVTEGYLNFDGRYRRTSHIPPDLHLRLQNHLHDMLGDIIDTQDRSRAGPS